MLVQNASSNFVIQNRGEEHFEKEGPRQGGIIAGVYYL